MVWTSKVIRIITISDTKLQEKFQKKNTKGELFIRRLIYIEVELVFSLNLTFDYGLILINSPLRNLAIVNINNNIFIIRVNNTILTEVN